MNHASLTGGNGKSASAGAAWDALPAPEISEKEFLSLRRLIHRQAGIHLSPQKKELLQARLAKIIRSQGLRSYQDYYRRVMADDSGRELCQLLNAISTNQTAFWREPAHFQLLSQEILPAWRQQRRAGLCWRFWCAGCSSGEEPYTLAMVLLENLSPEEVKNVRIYASDLNTQVLEQARQGIYPAARTAPLPLGWQTRFFQKGVGRQEGFVRLKPQVRELVEFFHLNLMDDFAFREEIDLIFCRNVMIYFDKETQAGVVEKFYRSLRPGGYLFLGHSESLCNIRHHFTYVKPTVYRK
ncbi:MAG: protein-glutamate O-methyltransferase CheR [Deltaproteobacteria bacterium]|nr:protein-glutamate O-methyltransferase CheR [Deltaproteobacteria bacterium]